MANKKKRRWLKILIIVGVICIIGVFVAVNMSKNRDRSTEVMVKKTKRGRLVETIPGTGRVQPEVQVNISANVSGKITGLFVEEGEFAHKGDLLITLDKERYSAVVEQAESGLKSAQAALKKSRSELKRTSQLFKQGGASEADRESAEADLQYRNAEVESSKAYLKQANDDYNKTSIYSPMDGIVSIIYKELGEMALGAQYQQDIILIVADLSKMEVEVEVDESDIINVSLSDTAKVDIDAYPDTTFRGVVREIAHTATTRGLGTSEEMTNFEVNITLLDVPASLRPGMSATADIITEVREDALYLPIQCVVLKYPLKEEKSGEEEAEESQATENTTSEDEMDEDETEKEMIEVVFRVEEGTAKQVAVATGISSDTDIEIISGLEEGDKIVSGPFRTLSQRLEDGDSVKEKKRSDRKRDSNSEDTSDDE
ncbi:efflux transporter periplasmic adaptor subunit [candidate division LCP-89 bacterium B3_LCP]|uniref:Efflux transporter periplasmic adaptor subunit n=1 Tax=candidate division LCP-89 bacterium B3_LCP TaxID=2012998 RepID=A0A532V2N5_UNCL8|nr:MAG: efflux transporter periplasmic adaptor subunit [candidate division LCP-89 bacterium B3_LCP]